MIILSLEKNSALIYYYVYTVSQMWVIEAFGSDKVKVGKSIHNCLVHYLLVITLHDYPSVTEIPA